MLLALTVADSWCLDYLSKTHVAHTHCRRLMLRGLTVADSCCLDSVSQTHIAWTAFRGLMLGREHLLQSPMKETIFCKRDI